MRKMETWSPRCRPTSWWFWNSFNGDTSEKRYCKNHRLPDPFPGLVPRNGQQNFLNRVYGIGSVGLIILSINFMGQSKFHIFIINMMINYVSWIFMVQWNLVYHIIQLVSWLILLSILPAFINQLSTWFIFIIINQFHWVYKPILCRLTTSAWAAHQGRPPESPEVAQNESLRSVQTASQRSTCFHTQKIAMLMAYRTSDSCSCLWLIAVFYMLLLDIIGLFTKGNRNEPPIF